MNTIELRIRGKLHRYTGPSCWRELSAHQTLGVMRLRGLAPRTLEQVFPLLTLLYGIRRLEQRWLFDEHLLRRQGIAQGDRLLILGQGQALLDSLAFLSQHDEEAHFNVARFRRYDYHFGTPAVMLRRACNPLVYVGPAAGMGNCTFGEFMAADMAYRGQNWALLAAILYRPNVKTIYANWRDRREAFDAADAEQRARQFRVLHPALLASVQHSYESTLLYLQRCFRQVFPPAKANAPAKKTNSNWLDVALGLAGLDVTKVHDIEQVNLYLALKTLNTKIQQANELDAQLDNTRRQ